MIDLYYFHMTIRNFNDLLIRHIYIYIYIILSEQKEIVIVSDYQIEYDAM